MSDEFIHWTRPKLEEFKKAYKDALSNSDTDMRDATFEFEGKNFILAYARYLIEHLERQV